MCIRDRANAADKEGEEKEEKSESPSDSNDVQSEAAVLKIAEDADFEKRSIQASGDESSTTITRK